MRDHRCVVTDGTGTRNQDGLIEVGTYVAMTADRDCIGLVVGHHVMDHDLPLLVLALEEPTTWTSSRPSGDRGAPLTFTAVCVAPQDVEVIGD